MYRYPTLSELGYKHNYYFISFNILHSSWDKIVLAFNRLKDEEFLYLDVGNAVFPSIAHIGLEFDVEELSDQNIKKISNKINGSCPNPFIIRKIKRSGVLKISPRINTETGEICPTIDKYLN